MRVGYNVGFMMGLLLGHSEFGQVMGQCETLAVFNLLAH